jgi:hypothetical protein
MNGTYIEMGALDGIKHSNSFVFHNQFGWKGLSVELGPKTYKQLVKNRPDELATVNAGVCNNGKKPTTTTTTTLHCIEMNAVGGIWEFWSPSFREQWWKGIDLNDFQDILDQHILNSYGDNDYSIIF